MKYFSNGIILLLLLSLMAAPPIGAGYAQLESAQSATQDSEASLAYESAARLLFWQSELYEQAGLREHENRSRALLLLNKALQTNALSPNGQVILGDNYLASDQPDQAIQIWKNLLNQHVAASEAASRLVKHYHANQKFAEEKQTLKQWLLLDKDNPQATQPLGLLFAAAGDSQALPLLQSASQASPDAAVRLAGLISAFKTSENDPAYRLVKAGQALAELGEWSLAQLAFQQAVRENAQYASAWAWLGLTRQYTGDANALQSLEYALKLDKDSAGLHAMLGNYWQQAGEIDKAQVQFKRAVYLEPANPAWWLALAEAQSQTDLSAALQSYSESTRLAPQDPATWYALASFCVNNNAFLDDYGMKAALHAFALEPGNSLYIDMLGHVQMSLGQWQAAEVMFEKALQMETSRPLSPYHFHLGLLYMQTNRNSKAKYEFEKTIQIDPQGAYGNQAKKLLDRYFP